MIRYLIVNADDFGLTAGVSRGILDTHERGIVTSTTAIVTRPIPDDLVDRLKRSGMGIGLHVNLTLGAPLTRAPSLVDEDGRFVRDPRQAAARAAASDVEREVDAQVERFEQIFGQPPTHLDTHHHIGLHAPVREVVLQQALKRGVPVRSQNAAARAAARTAGLDTPAHFFGEAGPVPYWTPERTLGHLKRLPPGISEFMTHPGYVDEALAYSRYGRQREAEMSGLGADARAAVEGLGVRLCDFRIFR
jgi:predicted glycoside hydrolase/deacetylase ChbG (UPF0249 family)